MLASNMALPVFLDYAVLTGSVGSGLNRFPDARSPYHWLLVSETLWEIHSQKIPAHV